MSRPRNQRRQPQRNNRSKPVDMWRPAPPLPEPAPISPVENPTALIRSLGEPPLGRSSVAAEHHLATVIERAAVLATALAASADLLAAPVDDD